MKIYSYVAGQMNKIAAMPVYDKKKKLKKSSSPEPADRFPRNLVCSIRNSCLSYFIQMMPLD